MLRSLGETFQRSLNNLKNHKAKKILISKEFIDSRLGTEIPAAKSYKTFKGARI